MKTQFPPRTSRFQRRLMYPFAVLGLVVAAIAFGSAHRAAAKPTPYRVSLGRIVHEIRELKRLVFHLKRDEYKARKERDRVATHRDRALRYANGGRHALHRTGLFALLQMHEHSPGQASMLQMRVGALEADNFVPEPETGFAGGDVSQLVHFCRTNNVGVRYGGRAQLIMSELVRDVVHEADARIAELSQRIELYKAQNIAHSDLIGRLMHCAMHCRHCHACYHHGYGYCGGVPGLVIDDPPGGLASKAYDVTVPRTGEPAPKVAATATDHTRLKFLTPDASIGGVDTTTADKIADVGNTFRPAAAADNGARR